MLKMVLLKNRSKRMDFLDSKRDYLVEPKLRQDSERRLRETLAITEEELIQMEQELLSEQSGSIQGTLPDATPENMGYSEEEILNILISEYEGSKPNN